PRRNQAAAAGQEEPPSLLRKIRFSPLPYLLFFVVLLGLLVAYFPSRTLTPLAPGEIAPSDIVVPIDIIIEDAETTEKRRVDAEAAVLAVYTYDPNVFLQVEDRIRQLFAQGRRWLEATAGKADPAAFVKFALETLGLEVDASDAAALIRSRFAPELEESTVGLVGKFLNQGVMLSKNLFFLGEPERGFTLVRAGAGERAARVGEILDLREAKALAVSEVEKLDLPDRNRNLVLNLTYLFLAPNIAYNKDETSARRIRARAEVSPIFYNLKRGKVLLRKGDEASEETVKLLRLVNRQVSQRTRWWPNFIGTTLLFALLLITLWYYLKSKYRRERAITKYAMMGTAFVLSLVLYRLSALLGVSFANVSSLAGFSRAETYFYAFPFEVGTLLFAFLTTTETTIVYAILNSLFVGYLPGGSFPLVIFSFVGGLAAMYGVKLYARRHRTSLLRTGIFVLAPVNIFVIITLHLIRASFGGFSVLFVEILMGIIGAVLGAGLAFVLLPIFESVFGFVTATRLLDLTNSDLPIFRQLALEAPGTYHHSLIVATLSEKAAEELKLNAALVKASALYHDIGKLKMPEYFIENRTRDDVHKDLTPSMSTLVIINHVKEGLELARKLKLPRDIRDVIEQHHGTSLVRFFYQKAKEKYDPDDQKVGEETFRYPGPVPRTREAALILLADSVEAASRSLRNPSTDSLRRVITDIFNAYLQDGQLDDCDFSLRQLRTAASTFLTILDAIHHRRTEYPGFEFEAKDQKGKK
ncbi:MAG: HDIG domain-containing protein, partial [Candidatus Aminicenantes bacterium]|nr:HDIG domain-containing protein [Candidatus Aminicenantes bacterium]